METEKYVRRPISLEQLFLFVQHNELEMEKLDEYDMYIQEDSEKFDANTVVYLDNSLEVDDDTEEEVYPDFAQKLDLKWFFSGQVIRDIIVNTQHQLTNPAVEDYIKNIVYYNENDCFMTL